MRSSVCTVELISIHALREEGDCCNGVRWKQSTQFLSTPSARRATCKAGVLSLSKYYFYPRPPRGGRRPAAHLRLHRWRYFYPRPPRGGRQVGLGVRTPRIIISIHALREEGDYYFS